MISVLNALQLKVVFERKYGFEHVAFPEVAEGCGRVRGTLAQSRKVGVAPLDAFYEVVAFPLS